jgi:hypothetical protein
MTKIDTSGAIVLAHLDPEKGGVLIRNRRESKLLAEDGWQMERQGGMLAVVHEKHTEGEPWEIPMTRVVSIKRAKPAIRSARDERIPKVTTDGTDGAGDGSGGARTRRGRSTPVTG